MYLLNIITISHARKRHMISSPGTFHLIGHEALTQTPSFRSHCFSLYEIGEDQPGIELVAYWILLRDMVCFDLLIFSCDQ